MAALMRLSPGLEEEAVGDGGERVQEVFARYQSCVQRPGSKPHPGDIAEASSLR